MKLNKLVIFMCMFFLLNIAIVFAADFDPIFTRFEAVSSNVRVTATLNIQVYDAGTNPGILWIRLYENGALLEEKNCGGLTSCSWQRQVTHTEGGTFSYYAIAKDKGANAKTSGTVQVIYTGDTPPQYSNLNVSPVSPVSYDPVQNHQFNATWTDDYNETADVMIEHDFTGVLTNYTVTTSAGDEYYYDYTGIPAGSFNYRWYAVDLSGLENSTAVQAYTVNQVPTVLTLTALPSWTEFNGTQTTVSCAADNTEVAVELYRDSVLVSNPDVQTLGVETYDYLCNTTGNQNYLADSVSNTLTINVLPPVFVLWNQATLDLGQAQQGMGPETGFENITATGDNTQVEVDCILGDCGVIADFWIDTNMTDGESSQVDLVVMLLLLEIFQLYLKLVLMNLRQEIKLM